MEPRFVEREVRRHAQRAALVGAAAALIERARPLRERDALRERAYGLEVRGARRGERGVAAALLGDELGAGFGEARRRFARPEALIP